MIRRLALILTVLTPLPFGQAETIPPKTPRSTVLKAAQILDVRSGTYLPNQAIWIEGERIREIGSISNIQSHAPPDAILIDLGQATLLPGLIDCHAHILGNLDDYSSTQALRLSSSQQTVWGMSNLRIWLDHGFTGLRDACESDLGYGQFALRDGVSRGLIDGPRIAACGGCISLNGGHGDANVLAPDQPLPRRANVADTVDEAATAVRRDLKYGADWIKLMATGGILDPFSDYKTQELSEAQMAKAVEVAHRAGQRVMVHAEGTEGIKAAVRAGVDSIEHGTVLDEEGARLMEAKGIWLVPTLSTFQYGIEQGEKLGLEPVMLEKLRSIIKFQPGAFHLALKHHLKIAFGLDNAPKLLPREFVALVNGGMQPIDAIRAATTNAAELLNWPDCGSIETGKVADLIATAGDPLKNIEELGSVKFVMKSGRIVKNELRTGAAPSEAPNQSTTHMIGRLWHGYTTPKDAEIYQEMLLTKILPGIHRVDGYKGTYLLRKDGADEVEFITLTLWDSLDAVKRFAGPDYEASVIAPEAKHLMIRHDERSVHYQAIWSE